MEIEQKEFTWEGSPLCCRAGKQLLAFAALCILTHLLSVSLCLCTAGSWSGFLNAHRWQSKDSTQHIPRCNLRNTIGSSVREALYIGTVSHFDWFGSVGWRDTTSSVKKQLFQHCGKGPWAKIEFSSAQLPLKFSPYLWSPLERKWDQHMKGRTWLTVGTDELPLKLS